MTVTRRRPHALWLRSRGSVPTAATRLICFPHAGGTAGYYLPLLQGLQPQVEVLAVQYPGRQDRMAEPAVEDLRHLADLIADQLLGLMAEETDGAGPLPYAFLGHSYGATVAYEVALRLAGSAGPGPAALYASGSTAPSRRRPHRPLPDGDALVADLRELGGTFPDLLAHPDLLELVLPPLRADYAALAGYAFRPGPVLGVPIWALIGDSDPRVTPSEACDWRSHTTGAFELRIFRGGHFYLADHQERLLRLLAGGQAAIARPPAAAGTGPAAAVLPHSRRSRSRSW